MMTIDQLVESTEKVLNRYFTVITNGVKLTPDVYDYTDAIFLEGEEGISVWCDFPDGAFKYFNGTVSMIVNVDSGLVCVNVFFGDECIDLELAEDRACAADLGRWEVEQVDDYLMLVTDFPADASFSEQLSARVGDLLSDAFISEIKETLACFR